ncbi:MAG: CPBP family intramembrane glutamic endopeptidase [Bacteroidia bacterium]
MNHSNHTSWVDILKQIVVPLLATMVFALFQGAIAYFLMEADVPPDWRLLGYGLAGIVLFGGIYLRWMRRKEHFKLSWPLVGISLIVVLVLSVLDRGVAQIWSSFTGIGQELSLEVMDRPGPSLIILIVSILMLPILEELFFRGVLLGFDFVRRNRPLLSILVTSLCFSSIHLSLYFPLESVPAVVGAFIFSIALSTLYLRTESLLLVILMHILYNSLSFISI